MPIVHGFGHGVIHQDPKFSPLSLSPALWLDASDQSTLVMDGAAYATETQSLSISSNSTLQTGNVDWWLSCWHYCDAPAVNYNRGIMTKSIYFNNYFDFDLNLNSYEGSKIAVSDGTNVEYASVNQLPYLTWGFYFCYKSGNQLVITLIKNGTTYTNTKTLTLTPIVTSRDFKIGGLSYLTGQPNSGYYDSACFGKPASGWLTSNATALKDYLYNGGAGRRSSDFKSSAFYTGGNPSGAVSFWDMDERTGTRKDRIGTNDLTASASSPTYASGVASGLVQYDGDPIKQWSDKSGNARHVTAPSDAARPTFKTSIQNGRSTVRYDGSDDHLYANSLASIFSGTNLPQTVCAVVKATTTSGRAFFGYGYSATIGPMTIYRIVSAANAQQWYARNDSGIDLVLTGPATSLGTTYVYSAVRSSSQVYMALNGVESSPSNYTGNFPFDMCTVGGERWGPNKEYFNGDIMELIVYSSALSTSQRQQVERYLASKWGIALS